MHEHDSESLVEALRELLRPHLERSEPLRRAVAIIGRMLVDEAQRTTPSTKAADDTIAQHDDGAQTTSDHVDMARATVALQLGNAEADVSVSGTVDEIRQARDAVDEQHDREGNDSSDGGRFNNDRQLDLGLIERRSRLKAASCRTQIERRHAVGDAWEALERAIGQQVATARSWPNCFLWAHWPDRTTPADDVLRTCAACYDALAAAAGLIQQLDAMPAADGHDVEKAMQLLAEADSALRIALEQTWLEAPDTDQHEAHLWLRQETQVRRIYIPRFMMLDDPADPASADRIVDDVQQLRAQVAARADRQKRIDAGFSKVRYHADQIVAGSITPGHDRQRIIETIAELGEGGVLASDRRWRQCLSAEAVKQVRAGEWSAAYVDEVLQHLESCHEAAMQPDDAEDAAAGSASRSWSDQVRAVQRLLGGRDLVVIGGEPRGEAIDRIKDAFHPSEVDWVRLTEHGSSDPMRAPIMRPNTGVVIVLVKLTGHLHANDARTFARDAGIPCVMVTGGYNPEQLADAVLQQASEELRRSRVSA